MVKKNNIQKYYWLIVIVALLIFASYSQNGTRSGFGCTMGNDDLEEPSTEQICTNTNECPYGYRCETKYVCFKAPCDSPKICRELPAGGQCDTDTDCPKGFTCTGNAPCSHPEQCATYKVCENRVW